MQRVDVSTAVENLVKPLIESEKMELVDVEYKKEGKVWYLRVFIDKDGGVNIDDCQNISYQIEKLLDVEDIIPHSYTLEVSSPGVERPLKRLKDYERFKEKLAKIYLYFSLNNKKNLVGKIIDVKGDTIIVEEKEGKRVIEINFKDISKANLIVEF